MKNKTNIKYANASKDAVDIYDLYKNLNDSFTGRAFKSNLGNYTFMKASEVPFLIPLLGASAGGLLGYHLPKLVNKDASTSSKLISALLGAALAGGYTFSKEPEWRSKTRSNIFKNNIKAGFGSIKDSIIDPFYSFRVNADKTSKE